MEDWFSYVMSFFHMALQNAVFFMATLRNALSRLDDLQFAAVVLSNFGVLVVVLSALVGMTRRLRRSADTIRLLNDDLAKLAQDLNVERVWRLAGGDGSERPSGDSLKELYRILARTMQVAWPDRLVHGVRPRPASAAAHFQFYCAGAGAGCAGSVSTVGSGDGSQVLSEK